MWSEEGKSGIERGPIQVKIPQIPQYGNNWHLGVCSAFFRAKAQAAAHADAADRAPPGTHRGHEARQRAAFEAPRCSSVKAAVGFEPTNNGFAIRPLRPLGYAAGRSRIVAQHSLRVNANSDPHHQDCNESPTSTRSDDPKDPKPRFRPAYRPCGEPLRRPSRQRAIEPVRSQRHDAYPSGPPKHRQP